MYVDFNSGVLLVVTLPNCYLQGSEKEKTTDSSRIKFKAQQNWVRFSLALHFFCILIQF